MGENFFLSKDKNGVRGQKESATAMGSCGYNEEIL
jgi:hypothetical protein